VIRKSVVILAVLSFTVCSLLAQSQNTPYDVSFSSAGAASVQFEFDITDSLMADPTLEHTMLYRDWASPAWNSEPVSQLYENCSITTMYTTISYVPPSTVLKYQFRSENEGLVVSQCPSNPLNDFPVPDQLMADLGADLIGDVEFGGSSHLDIAHCYGAYSDTRIYFRLESASGGFPTSTFPFDYYAYGVIFDDPDVTDEAAFALIYVDIPFIFTPGLYSIDPSGWWLDSRIADISVHIDGSSLSMSCDASDLTSQSGWSTWPPASRFIDLQPMTATSTYPEAEFTINDRGKHGFLVFDSK